MVPVSVVSWKVGVGGGSANEGVGDGGAADTESRGAPAMMAPVAFESEDVLEDGAAAGLAGAAARVAVFCLVVVSAWR